MNIKILDCTLRDGGYVNNWDFGKNLATKMLTSLDKSGIEYTEIGFLQDTEYNPEKTLYNEISQINNIIPDNQMLNTKIVAMIVCGKFNEKKLVSKKDNIKLDVIRVTFKKHEINTVFNYLKKIKECGYELFVNPTNIESYSDKELLNILEKINKLQPRVFSIVDTNGVLKEKDILRLTYFIDNNLDRNIALCFHSHNNLQLSFSNAQCLMKVCNNRELIIDSTVFGMGRGAGNLCTELITQYINDNYDGHYDIVPILKIIDEQINPIFAKTPWGYSVPYYLAATNHCHPNYAKYLVDRQTVPVEIINELLQAIPKNKKAIYDSNLIKQLYLDNFSAYIDDSAVVNNLQKSLCGKDILIIAPGKSLSTEQDKICEFIANKKPYILSINFIPKDYDVDTAFISNMKRFSSLVSCNKPILVTSNIEDIPNNAMVLNYSSYLNNSKMYDNATLMCLKLLISIGVKSVYVAGLDGFCANPAQNYVSNEMINNTKESKFNELNKIMSEELRKLNKKIRLDFITKTQYSI